MIRDKFIKDQQIKTFWRVIKKRLKDDGNKIVTNCNDLKLNAQYGKYRITDKCDIGGR